MSTKKMSAFFFCFVFGYAVQSRFRWTSDQVLGSRSLYVNFPKDRSLRVFLIGDTGSGNQNQMDVAAAMEARCQELGEVDALFLLGDNFYMRGVSSTQDKQWIEKVNTPYRSSPCLSSVPIYPILGNHDIRQNPGAQIEYSKKDSSWRMPARFYHVDFGTQLRVIAFDSSYPDVCLSSRFCSIDFLLSMANLPFTGRKVVVSHHPLSSASQISLSHNGGWLGALLKPHVCGRVESWINGHSHHMEHRLIEGCETDFVVSGAGGGDLEPVRPDHESQFVANQHGFLELEVSADAKMTFQFRDLKSQSVYHWMR